jgi:hypothetical protein
MSSHVIVYLDQSYLSNMAKAQLGSIKDEDLAKFWSSLFNDLRKAVLDNKIACSELEFHGAEARYDRRLEESIRQVIYELSWGLQFRPWQSILDSQVEDAAIKFLNKKPVERESWMIAFQTDPHAPVESRMENIAGIKGRINIHMSLPNEVTEQDRQLKLGFMDEAQRLLDEYRNNPSGWPELLLQSKRSFWDGFWGKRARQFISQGLQGNSPWNHLIALDKHNKLVNLFNRLQEIGINIDEANIMSFAESKELFDSPFGDINASIWAAIGECYRQGRKVQKGDFYDVPILATVLPYCDIVTTDSFMKEIIVKILHFDDKYKAMIFSATKEDRLAFQKLIQEL